MNLYEYEDEIITTESFLERLSPHIEKGDTLALEMDTMRFGRIAGGITKTRFLEGIFEIFHHLVGPDGTLIVPTFSYSWGVDSPEKRFDVRKTPGRVGIFPEYFRRREDTYRSLDPMFSFALWGNDKEFLGGNEYKTSFGKNSLYDKIRKFNAKLISFGLMKYDPTFSHFIEQFYHENIQEISYRFIKKFEGIVVGYDGVAREDHQYCFSRHLDQHTDLVFNEKKLVADLRKNEKLREVTIGNGQINISDCDAVFQAGIAGMASDPFYFVDKVGPQSCLDTV